MPLKPFSSCFSLRMSPRMTRDTPRFRRSFGLRTAEEKLSNTITRLCFESSEDRCEPIKPAPPVIRMVAFFKVILYNSTLSSRSAGWRSGDLYNKDCFAPQSAGLAMTRQSTRHCVSLVTRWMNIMCVIQVISGSVPRLRQKTGLLLSDTVPQTTPCVHR